MEERIEIIEHQKVLNGRVFDTDIIIEFGMTTLFNVVSVQDWSHCFECPTLYLYELEIREFLYNMELLKDEGITTIVIEIRIDLNEEILGIIFVCQRKELDLLKDVNHPYNSP